MTAEAGEQQARRPEDVARAWCAGVESLLSLRPNPALAYCFPMLAPAAIDALVSNLRLRGPLVARIAAAGWPLPAHAKHRQDTDGGVVEALFALALGRGVLDAEQRRSLARRHGDDVIAAAWQAFPDLEGHLDEAGLDALAETSAKDRQSVLDAYGARSASPMAFAELAWRRGYRGAGRVMAAIEAVAIKTPLAGQGER